ncbi:hypothetical protein A2V49_03510 [candidate division WWE3 bacterium RBG_19FT_COMBO_34_6]|uniref:Uncharacterized protein n=1 Tax=candidate division WWE3 bacterium RBG_19FT_COMBO_34_6 TaxID=1802612 RepID=A0A1F4UMF7_UNCKA|nr:MAG: hypothetical protein A2V49_03510 [candidate division WWE3 bacterium RBG_19FT_COMBO_34_6]
MQFNIILLSKKAINAALKNDWDLAIEINELILSKDPQNKDAQIRLGRAYIKKEKFNKAKKIFSEILKDDPINQIAQKNYQLASEKNKDNYNDNVDIAHKTKSLIKEPGTSTEAKVFVTKKIKKVYEAGELLSLKINKNTTKVMDYKTKRELGSLDEKISRILYSAKKNDKDILATFIKTNHEHFSILLKCKNPIFKSEKQSEKPYMKGILDENEDEVSEIEEEEII